MLTPQTIAVMVWGARFMRVLPAVVTSAFVLRSIPAIEGATDALQTIGGTNLPFPAKVVRFIGFMPFRMVAGAGAGAIKGVLSQQARTSEAAGQTTNLVLQILKSDNGYLILPGKEFIPYITAVGTKVTVVVILTIIVYWISNKMVGFVVHYIQLRVEASKTGDQQKPIHYKY